MQLIILSFIILEVTKIRAVVAGQIQLMNIKAPAIVPIVNPPPENAKVITRIQTIVGTPEMSSTTLIINVSTGLPALKPAIAPYIEPIIVENNETNKAMNKEFDVLIHNTCIQSLPCGPVIIPYIGKKGKLSILKNKEE